MFSSLKNSLSLRALAAALRDISIRFPLSVLACVVFAVTLIGENHDFTHISSDAQAQIALGAVCGFFWFLFTRLFCEAHGWSRAVEFLLACIGFALIEIHIVMHDPDMPAIWLLMGGLILSVMAAPFIGRKSDNLAFWNFNCVALTRFAVAMLSALILAGGAAMILMSCDYLFGADISNRAYGDVWILSMSIFCPLMSLTGVPRDFDHGDNPIHQPGAPFIISYVMTPLLLIYMAVLYAYAAKIAIQWEVPRGHVTYMVSAFGITGIALHLLAYPLRESGTRLVRFLYKWFYPALLAPLALLGVAISMRVGQYGVTETRYLVMMGGVWMAVLSLGYVIRRPWRTGANVQLKNVPALISLLLVLSAFGPWGAQSVSISSQYDRLQVMLSEAGILKDGRIHKLEGPADFALSQNITSIVTYLSAREQLDKIRPWFDPAADVFQTVEGKTIEPAPQSVMQAMGLKMVNRWESQDNFNIYNHGFELDSRLMDVSGYSYMTALNLYTYDHDDSWSQDLSDQNSATGYSLAYNAATGRLKVMTPVGETLVFDIGALAADLWARNLTEVTGADSKLMDLSQGGEKTNARLYINSMNGVVVDGRPQVRSLRGYLLLN